MHFNCSIEYIELNKMDTFRKTHASMFFCLYHLISNSILNTNTLCYAKPFPSHSEKENIESDLDISILKYLQSLTFFIICSPLIASIKWLKKSRLLPNNFVFHVRMQNISIVIFIIPSKFHALKRIKRKYTKIHVRVCYRTE